MNAIELDRDILFAAICALLSRHRSILCTRDENTSTVNFELPGVRVMVGDEFRVRLEPVREPERCAFVWGMKQPEDKQVEAAYVLLQRALVNWRSSPQELFREELRRDIQVWCSEFVKNRGWRVDPLTSLVEQRESLLQQVEALSATCPDNNHCFCVSGAEYSECCCCGTQDHSIDEEGKAGSQ